MSLPTTRSARPSQLRSSLESVIGYLRKENVESAGKTLRLLVDTHPIPRDAFVASQAESVGSTSPALSIATLGARIALENTELEAAVELVKYLQLYREDAPKSISPTILHVISGLIEVASSESLAYAASLIESIRPKLLPRDLIQQFYCAAPAELVGKICTHVMHSGGPCPAGRALLELLKKLCGEEEFGPMIYLVTTILKSQPPEAQSLPPEIPIELAAPITALAARAGATQQSFRLWSLAGLQIGYPKVPISLEQAQFFGDASMTYSLVRHFMKLAEKDRKSLQRWHLSQLIGNRRMFVDNAETVYNTFATVHGFDLEGRAGYSSADHYQVATSIACLFALNRFTPAMDALNEFFRRNELPDEKDLGIILGALARRHAGRAVQILLEAAPAHIPGFTPTPFLYNIVLHHSLLQDREDDAARIMNHARNAGAGSLEPKSLDALLRSAIKKIIEGSKRDKQTNMHQINRAEQAHLFKRIFEVLDLAQHHARPSTIRSAIKTALEVGQPTKAWRIWMLAKKYRRLGVMRKGPDGKKVQQEEFGPSSTWHIAKGLWAAKGRGIIEEPQMWKMIDDMGVKIPDEAKKTGEWTNDFELVREEENQTSPISLRRKLSNINKK